MDYKLPSKDLIPKLEKILGPNGILEGDDVHSRGISHYRRDEPCLARAIARPATTKEVAEVIKLCAEAGQKIVPIGGNTGLVDGQRAAENEIQISLERMNQVEHVDTNDRTATVQAGTPLQTVQEAAEAANLFFPLDIGGRGTATIGGNISTNAGGNRVVRYGMARDMVLGLEAVLADGTIISSMNRMIKNNAGYDLKQLFIGTEGTLGIVTRAVLRLREKPRSESTAMVALDSFDNVISFFKEIDAGLGGTLSAFEVMWNRFYQFVTAEDKPQRAPMGGDYPYYILVESLGGDPVHDNDHFAEVLMSALESGTLSDAVIAKSDTERQELWDIRDGVLHFNTLGPHFNFDISMRISDMESYSQKVLSKLDKAYPDNQTFVFGHIGDGNMHITVSVGDGSSNAHKIVEHIIYGNLISYHGSVSAEHGIGLEKRDYLSISRNEAEIVLMRRLKKALDPEDLFNSGKVVGGKPYLA